MRMKCARLSRKFTPSDKVEAANVIPPPAASTAGPYCSPASDKSAEVSEVGQVRVWNADTYTRIIIPLNGQAKYQAARISDPDRIYFDIEGAKLGAKLSAPVDVPSGGYLKTVRMAQNNPDVVRVVLEVTKVKDYSVFELANPDRLVVDVYGPGADIAPSATETGAKHPDGSLQTVSSRTLANGPGLDASDTPAAAARKTPKNGNVAALSSTRGFAEPRRDRSQRRSRARRARSNRFGSRRESFDPKCFEKEHDPDRQCRRRCSQHKYFAQESG